jgi:hypothetical protein
MALDEALIARTARDLYIRALKVLPPDVKAALGRVTCWPPCSATWTWPSRAG